MTLPIPTSISVNSHLEVGLLVHMDTPVQFLSTVCAVFHDGCRWLSLTLLPSSRSCLPSLPHSRTVLQEDSRVDFPICMERRPTIRRGHLPVSLTEDILGSLGSLGLSILLRNTFQCSQRNQAKYPRGSHTSALAHIAEVMFPTLGISRISDTCTRMASWELLGSYNKGRMC